MDQEQVKKRIEAFFEFIANNNGQNFNAHNIGPILRNLHKADQDGCLWQFMMNEKPYISSFPYIGDGAARGKDQVAIVFAINMYAIIHPGFAARLHSVLLKMANAGGKQTTAVHTILLVQMDLQERQISIINFVDRELAETVNRKISGAKKRNLLLYGLLTCACAIALPGSAMLGLIPITILAIPGFIYCGFSFLAWCFRHKISENVIAAAAMPVAEVAIDMTLEDELSEIIKAKPQPEEAPAESQLEEVSDEKAPEAKFCRRCGAEYAPDAKFCRQCGTKRGQSVSL